MSQKLVRHEVDLSHLPPLTETQEAQLAALENQAESEIDYSEIVPLTDAFWKAAERGWSSRFR